MNCVKDSHKETKKVPAKEHAGETKKKRRKKLKKHTHKLSRDT